MEKSEYFILNKDGKLMFASNRIEHEITGIKSLYGILILN